MIASFPWTRCASSRTNANIRLDITFVKKKDMIFIYYFVPIKMSSIRADLTGTKRRFAHNPPPVSLVKILNGIVTFATLDEGEAGELDGRDDLAIRTQFPVRTVAYLLHGCNLPPEEWSRTELGSLVFGSIVGELRKQKYIYSHCARCRGTYVRDEEVDMRMAGRVEQDEF